MMVNNKTDRIIVCRAKFNKRKKEKWKINITCPSNV